LFYNYWGLMNLLMTHNDFAAAWAALAEDELKGKGAPQVRSTIDGLDIKPVYSSADFDSGSAGDAWPGFAPYKRGVKATMYAGRPWTIRQYAGFSTAEESNAFYHKALAGGQKGLSVAFDLATHRGYDSDHPRVSGDVGKAGVAIDSVEDMKVLFSGIPLKDISVSMTMNGAVLPVLASFIVAAEEQGVAQHDLSGTIQNDILKEFIVRNTYIYPPEPSMRIVTDIIAHTARHMPRFNSISISGYHMQEAGASLVQELAFTLANGKEYVRQAVARGLDVDAIGGRLSFFFAVGMNFFAEAAKLRAARVLWHRIMMEAGALKSSSLILRTHCQTSGVSLQEKDPYNNIIRTTLEGMSAVLGGTQSLHTNSFDEAIALPTEFAARIARNTQLILQHETGVTDVADPLAGSYYVESLTQQLVDKAWDLIMQIDATGGMTRAVAEGIPKRMIEETATRRQALIDKGEQVVVGVNAFRAEDETAVDVRVVDTAKVRDAQMKRLHRVKAQRDESAVRLALAKLEMAARGDGNLLEAAIVAARVRATVGEISDALRLVFGDHTGKQDVVRSVYAQAYGDEPELRALKQKISAFSAKRAVPKVLVVKLGQDGHDRGAHVIASAFSDFGFDTVSGPMFQTPDEAADLAKAEAVQVVGVSTLAGSHTVLVPELMAALRQRDLQNVIVVCGGVVPRQDYDALRASGVSAIFGPGTPVLEAAQSVLNLLEGRLVN
jgi:methylmalonyl-CoA mutase